MTHLTGELQLSLKVKPGKTVPEALFHQGALKVMRPQYLDESGQLTYFLLNPGGGYLTGDRYLLDVSLDENAQLFLTTQSATKIYRTPNADVRQQTFFRLKQGSELVYLPDHVIAYEDSKFVQEQICLLEKGSSYFASEIITPGWDSQGRGFTYRELNFLTKIFIDDQLKIMDRLYLNPSQQCHTALGMLEGNKNILSIFILQEQIEEQFVSVLREQLMERFPDVKCGLSLLPISGVTIRALGNSTQELQAFTYFFYEFYSEKLFQREGIHIRKY